jgi:hypothetical protein
MAKRKGKKTTAAQRKQNYYGLIEKSYKRLRSVMQKHHPEVIAKEG